MDCHHHQADGGLYPPVTGHNLRGFLLSVFWYWNRRLAQVNLKIRSTLSELNLVQAQLERQNQKLKKN